jgi:hypothetical protein
MRIFQNSHGERISRSGFAVSQNTGNQSGNGINHHQGRQLSSRKYIVADGNFSVRQMFPDPFIHTLIMTADKDNPGIAG